MEQRCSTPEITRITSAQKYTGLNSFGPWEADGIRMGSTWRQSDPPGKTVGDLSPDDFGRRVVIRSRQFLGTVYGTLVGTSPYRHRTPGTFTTVQLMNKRELTFRSDTEVLVLD